MEWLRYGAQHYPDRICINEYTYKDIYGGVLHVASELLPLESSRVAILSDNSVTMAIYVLAAMLAHKEVLLLNVHLKPNEIENQLKQLGITTVLHSKERRNQLTSSLRAIEFEPLESILSNLNLEDTFDWKFDDADIAAIMNTSATTGQFKSVPLRWG